MEVENLNKTSEAFTHFHRMFLYVEPNIVWKLFQNYPDYAYQTIMPIESRLQFLFLAAMHRLHVPSIMLSFTGNCTASYRDPDKILKEYEEYLSPELLA